jgi:excisionase family DNA binding protein
MNLDELDGRYFADVPEVASITGRDERTIRKAAAAGEIPSTKVGNKYMIPVAWLREQAGQASLSRVPPPPDLDQLVDRIADRVFARFAGLFAAQMLTADAPQAPAATTIDLTDPRPNGRKSDAQRNPG